MPIEDFVSERELARSPATRVTLTLLRRVQPLLRWILAPLIAFPLGVAVGRRQSTPPPKPPPPQTAATPTLARAAVASALTPIAAVAPKAPAPIETPNAAADETSVRRVLREYVKALESLDVNAAVRIWPTVDRRALARLFSTVASQDLEFDRCDVKAERSTAVAQCRGKLRYVRKYRRRTPQVEPYQWQFRMQKRGADWMIDRVTASRL